MQTYLGEITRSTGEHHLDVGRAVVVKMLRYNAGDNARFLCLIFLAQHSLLVVITTAHQVPIVFRVITECQLLFLILFTIVCLFVSLLLFRCCCGLHATLATGVI